MMTIFSSCKAAIREGFRVLEFDIDYRLYLVVKDLSRGGRKMMMLAFAQRDP